MIKFLKCSIPALVAIGLTSCATFDYQITDLEADPDGVYCKVEDSEGGVVFIRNEIAARAAKALGELPSCSVLYNTFYRNGPIDEQIRTLDAKVERLEKRVTKLEKK